MKKLVANEAGGISTIGIALNVSALSNEGASAGTCTLRE